MLYYVFDEELAILKRKLRKPEDIIIYKDRYIRNENALKNDSQSLTVTRIAWVISRSHQPNALQPMRCGSL
jgi:hypothetical protein